jgi:PBP1b-binding outer membrane lipoprotein LpoB
MRLRRTASALLLLILLSGCSSGDKPAASEPAATVATTAAPTPMPTSTATARPEDDLKAAITDYSTAYLTGDGAAAYGLLSQRCQTVLPLSEFASLTEQARDLYGDVKIESVDVEVDGKQATATYTYAVPAINQTDEPWLIEGTRWKNDDC